MDSLLNNRKVLILAGAAGIVLIAVLIFAFSSSQNGSNQGATPTPSTSQDGKLAYIGTNLLIARGATTQHVENFKFAVHRFAEINNLKPTEATVTNVRHLHDSSNATSTDILQFDLAIDQKTVYKASLEYNNLSSSRLVLRNSTSQPVFDSGVIKVDTSE